MNVYEMEGFLRGKCMPRDILVNESTAEYLVRKLNEATTVKAERDAQQKRADALAVENAALKDSNRKLINEQQASWPIGLLDSFIAEHDPETPATDAALAAIEARGVEKFADSEHCSQEAHFCAYCYLAELREAK
ncbi:Uncharacterised protein [Serratia ficaria]|uniref:hypothetical protein n=1 Tax=Serratia ficaria TaxID=61651 RepID=UPI002177FA8B|nr:hypothetical protein [Serratia ficaria]CAI2080667.1 Uncharacterised protein [Serratia ficaria]CAI2490176.1 Uncharacterised protein [Serratia ficaria]